MSLNKKINKALIPLDTPSQEVNNISNLKSNSNNKRLTGFTLLEILLVIGIIAVLAGIVIIAINPSKQLAQVRNTERRSDIRQLNNALEQYYIDNRHYISGLSTTAQEICDTGNATSTHSIDCTGLADLSALVPTYLTAIPTDPKGQIAITGSGYKVALDASGKLYLNAVLSELATTIEIGKSAGVVGITWTGTPRYWIATTASNWNSTANWSATSGGVGGASVPNSTNDAIFDSQGNGNCTLNSAVDVKGFFITNYTGTVTQTTYTFTVGADGYEQSSGILTHADNSTAETYKLNLTVNGNFTLNAGGSINVDGKGYDANQGPGRPLAHNNREGGSYGGMGSAYGTGIPGPTYGSLIIPINLGSGGDQGSGGGAIIINISEATNLFGAISANGQSVMHHGGGSGGTVSITTGTVSGSGVIQTNGGKDLYSSGSGSGYGAAGGGRVSIILTDNGSDFNNFSGLITAYGGSAGTQPGAAGTIYKQTASQGAGQGTLVIDNNNLTTATGVTTAVPPGQTWDIYNLVLQNKGIIGVDTGQTLVLHNDNIISDEDDNNDGIRLNGGTLSLPTDTLTINDWTLISDTPSTLTGDITVESGGNITHSDNSTTETYKLNLTVNGNFTLNAGGTVNVDGRGYDANKGPGEPVTGSWVGGSYGGFGGDGYGGGTIGPTYGSITAPVNIGSGGTHTSGGGAILLTVTGSTNILGAVSAIGNPTVYGSGSGGSIYIITGTLIGSGSLIANGGGSSSQGSGGGGGRVVVILTNAESDFNNFSGSITAYGGNSSSKGAAGTIYKQTASQGAGQGTLIVDNNNLTTATGVVTAISTSTTDTTVGNIILQNKGNVTIESGQTLTAQNTGTSLLINANSILNNLGTLMLGGTYVNNGTLTGYP